MSRPINFKEFIGQSKLKEYINLQIQACTKTNTPFPHTLIYGSAGLGKTTFANIIAKELNRPFHILMGGTLQTEMDIANIFTLAENSIVFIDEIHSINFKLEEILYPLMEDFIYVSNTGNKIPVNKFTIIGATTNSNRLTKPFRDRFVIQLYFNEYTPLEMFRMGKELLNKYNLSLTKEALRYLTERTRGTPRHLYSFIHNLVNYNSMKNKEVLEIEDVVYVLTMLGIDEKGLNIGERKYLNILNKVFKGGPVGIKNISKSMNESIDFIENQVEPYLINNGYILLTSKGRVLNKI